MKIQTVRIETIQGNKDNPRLVNKAKYEKLKKSIQDFPEMLNLRPLIVNEHNVILGGNMRYKALVELGYKEVPVIKAEDLTERQAQEFIVKDNLSYGDWDFDILANEWDSVELEDWGLDVWQNEDDVIAHEAEEDDYVEPEEMKVDVVLGDLIEIGEHRLLCGDSTDSKQWERLEINKNTICFTSPPYNAGKSAKLTGNKAASNKGNFYESYNDDSVDYSSLISESLANAIMFTNGVCYNVQPLAGNKVQLIEWLSKWKDSLVDILTWNKGQSQPAMAKGVCSSTFEWLIVFNKENNSRRIPLSSWRGTVSNVYSEPPQRNNEYSSVHAATFPIHLPEFVIGKLMDKSEAVVDCFIGTGTTMVAAHQLKRKCYGMELDPKYCQVIIDRMLNLDNTLEVKINGKPYTK